MVEQDISDNLEAYPTFESMGLKDDLLKGIYSYGFEKPSAVQQRAIVPIIQRKDIIVQSQSGTGKTCVFSVGSLQIIDISLKEPQVLILAPTRELAEQNAKVMSAVGDFLNAQVYCLVGGKSLSEDMKRLDHGVHIVSGTPGRVFDMIQRKHFRTKQIKLLILDEADQMLTRGFKDQVYDIYRYLPYNLQCVIVSATLPQEILEMTEKFMNQPLKILVKRDELSLEGIKQYFVSVEKEE